jgi:NAD dependent epimerase/dehydratase
VTGGCGFIGSHLVEALLQHGAVVSALGRYNSRSDLGFLSGVESSSLKVHLGDVSDLTFVQSVSNGIDTVFHLAALIGIPYSYVAPTHYVETNIKGTVAVLEAARSAGVRRIVHTSTSETYGSAQYTPIDEDHPLVGQSPYSATKIGADKLAESYHRSFGLPVAILRPFNTFGPRQSLRAVIPTAMAQALYAPEIRVGSLQPVRDMNFVTDTVAGFLGLAAADGVEGQTFNVGSGKGRSVAEILEGVQRVAGTAKPVVVQDERVRPPDSEVETLVCDFTRAHQAFGYQPQVDFEDGLVAVRDYLAAHAPSSDVSVYRV